MKNTWLPSSKYLFFLFTVVSVFAGCSPEKAKESPPNFIFIITDDMSAEDLSVYGNHSIRTPNLDDMASQGIVFDNAWLAISSCSPSRNSIITGRYPHNTGAPEVHSILPADQQTFVQVLQKAGYHTVLSGKNHMAPFEQLGFLEYSDSHPAGSENWVKHLQERPAGKPFFFWFASYDSHRDWQQDDYGEIYQPGEVKVPPYMYDGPRTREDLTGYYHEISRSDHYLGKIREELKKQGLEQNTYVFYMTDNGRPFPRSKTYMYGSGLRTPLIITGPEIKPGRTASLVSSIDVSATILELAGMEKPETVQGVSFRPLLNNHEAVIREIAFAERNWHRYRMHERMVRSGDWLYIRNNWPNIPNLCGESDSSQFPAARELWEMHEQNKLTPQQAKITLLPQPAEELYNIKTDPHNLNNVRYDPANREVLHQMRMWLTLWINQTDDNIPENPTPTIGKIRAEWKRGEMSGEATKATQNNNPGPVYIDKSTQ